MSNFFGIDHVQLAAPKGSEEKARLFFGEILGMKEIPKPSNLAKRGGVWFQCGHHQLHIGIQEHFQAAKKAHPAFLVRSLSELKEALLKYHIRISEDEPLEGANRFYVEDPFGNRIEFLERRDKKTKRRLSRFSRQPVCY
ncbi:VOC family protein [Bacillus sp. FSL L8-0167]|uniref:VOC family protein n=2 Tax=Bacillus TaxID=1386 RepID=UPI00061B438E|nr:VOC family protein [Bacillus safensis]KKD40998.1 glyoxalase [Bacillus safensis]MCM3450459.1 VOC family protein [Bacillus safensis]MDR6681994.1 catechol 2,3-dioxygenase-like lactoylglutathione lyase family enzyme [Bacillus safensis]MEC0948441.1 VOC family protein [Bacillus safensis]MED5092023.1 VOC family protein [Bacillus safensis]